MLRLFDCGWWMFSKMRLQRDNVLLQFAFRLIVINFFQFLNAALLVKFKVIAQRVFGNPDHFCDFLMQHAVRFEA